MIDLYFAEITEVNREIVAEMLKVLNADENQVYKNYLAEHKKKEFLVGRFMLKSILAHNLGVVPRQIEFARNNYGKLYLRNNLQKNIKKKIKFNLSHSCGLVVCVLTQEREIGIDVEKVNRELLEIAKRFFSQEEIQYILQQAPFQNEAAYKVWTLKEAYIKAKGIGLSLDLRSFNVLGIQEMYLTTIVPKPDFYLSVALEKKLSEDIDVVIRVNEVRLTNKGYISSIYRGFIEKPRYGVWGDHNGID